MSYNIRRVKRRHFQKHNHHLVYARKGAGRYVPGLYTCQCGERFTSVKEYERHRSERLSGDKRVA